MSNVGRVVVARRSGMSAPALERRGEGRDMLQQLGRPVSFLASWLGGWFRLLLLVLAIVAVGGGLLWERQRQTPVPPNAVQVTNDIVGDLRKISFRYPGTIADVQAFYQQVLAARGWRYCGTQSTPGCTNMTTMLNESAEAIDVYRRTNDVDNQGATIEVWPVNSENGQVFVTVFETRAQ